MIKARNIDPASALRYIAEYVAVSTTAAIANAVPISVWAYPARYPVNLNQAAASAAQAATPWSKIVDVILFQPYAGVGGTSQTFTVLKNGTTIFSTAPVMSLAAGANAVVDSDGVIALPSGCTRAVLKTDSTILLKKGDVLSYTCTVSGVYSTAPNIGIAVVIDPSPV